MAQIRFSFLQKYCPPRTDSGSGVDRCRAAIGRYHGFKGVAAHKPDRRAREKLHSLHPLFPPHFPSLPPRQGKIFEEVSLSRPVTHSPLYWRREEPHLGKLKRTKRVSRPFCATFLDEGAAVFWPPESSRQPWDGTCGLRLACPLWSALTPILQRISCWPCLPGTRP